MSRILIDTLNLQTVITTWNGTGTFSNSGFIIPPPSFLIPKSLSYDFRVAEYVNEKDEIVKVKLQVAVFEHDTFGVRQLRQNFVDVDRVKIPMP
jgi:hypothetical protein